MTLNIEEKNLLLFALGRVLWEMEDRLSMLQVPEEVKELKDLIDKIEKDNDRERVERLLPGVP